jgi:hypothetical protein
VSRSGSARPSGSTPTRARAATGSAQTSRPKIRATPASGRNNPTAMDKLVVLPAPFGPTRPKNDPGGTTRVTSSTATLGPNCLRSPANSNAGTPSTATTPVIIQG